MTQVTDDAIQSRYELNEKGLTAFAAYRRNGAAVVITHVEAPLALRGTGAAGRLMDGIVEIARRDNLHLIPQCSYAAAWFQRHPDVRDVLSS